MKPFNLPSSLTFLALACVLPCRALVAQERKEEPAADAVKAWYAFYHQEAAHAYRFKLEPGDADL